MRKLRFDDALAGALAWARRNAEALGDVHLVRDIYGRIRVVPGHDGPIAASLVTDLHEALGAFSPGEHSIILDPAYFSEDELAPDRVALDEHVFLVDRLVSEQGWRRAPVATPGHRPRVVFFGLKGGVGRSTALVAVAKRFAEQGRRVLVVDLDLESPGATSMLLRPEELPEYGAVDWFVEDAVGQGDEDLLHRMVMPSRVGEILVVPALGRRSMPDGDKRTSAREGAFVAKLGRTYASPDGAEFAVRVEGLIAGLEQVATPDVVLIDSRAGMHDISAAVVPRLGATVLLFAGATSQTWLGYRLLFSAWMRKRSALMRFRDRLRVVAAQVPEVGRERYLSKLRLASYDLFASYVYDDSEIDDAYNYDVEAKDAPHAPLPIYWRRELVEWEPAAEPDASEDGLTTEQFNAAFGPFLRGVFELPYVGDLSQPGDDAP